MSKKRDKKFSEEETTNPQIGAAEIAKALGASTIEPAVDAIPIGQIRLSKAPPLDLAAVESEYGWWEAIQRADIRLFEAWLAHHGAIIISSRTIERYDAFFQGLTSRQSVVLTDHEVGFVLRRAG